MGCVLIRLVASRALAAAGLASDRLRFEVSPERAQHHSRLDHAVQQQVHACIFPPGSASSCGPRRRAFKLGADASGVCFDGDSMSHTQGACICLGHRIEYQTLACRDFVPRTSSISVCAEAKQTKRTHFSCSPTATGNKKIPRQTQPK